MMLGVSRCTFSRYVNGRLLMKPRRLYLLSKILSVDPFDLYPRYCDEFMTPSQRQHARWRNQIFKELLVRRWDIKDFSVHCNIQHSAAYSLVHWSYVPTEPMIRRLETAFGKSRDEFWLEWHLHQYEYYDFKNRRMNGGQNNE